jgi:hypothetical protein
MAIGKREKIVAFSLVGLAAILAVHIAVFSKKSGMQRAAEQRFYAANGSLSGLYRPESPLAAQRYQEKTEQFKNQFGEIMRGFELATPPYWGQTLDSVRAEVNADPNVPKEPATAIEAEVQRRWSAVVDQRWNDIYALLDRLTQLRAEGETPGKPVLAFLDYGDYGWNFPRGLPRLVQQGQRNLFDLLATLEGNYKSIAVSGNQAFRDEQFRAYGATTAFLDINFEQEAGAFAQFANLRSASLFDIHQLAGPKVPFFKLVQHVRLFQAAAPADLSSSLASRKRLLEVLGMNTFTGKREVPFRPSPIYPPPDLPGGGGKLPDVELSIITDIESLGDVAVYRQQLVALVDLIERAGKAGIVRIDYVKMRDVAFLSAIKPPVEPLPAGATPTPEPPPPDPGAPPPGGMGMPIEMVVSGPNQTVIAFLYDITHCHRTYELDSIRLQRQPAQTGQVFVRCDLTLNVLTNVWAINNSDYAPTPAPAPMDAPAATPAPTTP